MHFQRLVPERFITNDFSRLAPECFLFKAFPSLIRERFIASDFPSLALKQFFTNDFPRMVPKRFISSQNVSQGFITSDFPRLVLERFFANNFRARRQKGVLIIYSLACLQNVFSLVSYWFGGKKRFLINYFSGLVPKRIQACDSCAWCKNASLLNTPAFSARTFPQ